MIRFTEVDMGAFLEISTSIPCILNCFYCPQNVLKESYRSTIKELSYDNFILAIDKIPQKSVVTWSAFNEPFQNNDTIDMILYAYKKGHCVQVNTTLVGLTLEKYRRIKDLPFGHFGIHLPDTEGKTVIPLTDQYLELLEYIVDDPPQGVNFSYHEGKAHSAISHLVKDSHKLIIHNRCGLLKEGRRDDHPNVVKCGQQFLFTNVDGGCVLLPNGDCVTCCQSFNMKEYLGNLFVQSWDEIKEKIKLTDMCKLCRYAIEDGKKK